MLTRMKRNWISHIFLVAIFNDISTLNIVHHFIKLNMHLSFDPGITFLDIHPREMETNIHTNTYTKTFINSFTGNNPNVLQ